MPVSRESAPPRSFLPPCRRVTAGGTRRGLRLWRSALRSDCTAVPGPRSCRRTRFVRFAHCTRTAAASQSTKRAARADLAPPLLVATDIAPAGCRLPRGHRLWFFDENKRRVSKGACGQAEARLWNAEKRRARGLARSASCDLTCRRLFERSERSERSEFGDRPRDRASQGSRRAAATDPAKRVSLPARAFATPRHARMSSTRQPRVTRAARPRSGPCAQRGAPESSRTARRSGLQTPAPAG